MFRKAFFSALAVSMTALLLPTIVGAVPPEIERESGSSELTLAGICGDGADLTLDSDFTSIVQTFFNSDGEITRELFHSRSEQLWSRSDTENTTVRRLRWTIETTFVDGEADRFSFSGPLAIATVPGQGPILLDTGRTVRNAADFGLILSAGPRQDLSRFFTDICDGLA